MSDLMEINGLDQSLPVDDTAILNKVDAIIEASIEMKNPYHALDFGRDLIQVSQLSGIALAKLFYLLKDIWDGFEIGDDFDTVAYAYVGRSKDTVDRYVRVWEMYEHKLIPEEFETEIRQKNIKDQIYIASMSAQGYEPDDDEWQEIVDAPDYNSVSAQVRKIKGKKPRKSALLIFISEDGSLTAEQKGITQYVGFLNIDESGDIREKAIQRLLRTAGVLQR